MQACYLRTVVTAVEHNTEWPRTCGCGESWDAAEWAELPSDGRYFAGGEGWMELRTCVCGARLVGACEAPEARR